MAAVVGGHLKLHQREYACKEKQLESVIIRQGDPKKNGERGKSGKEVGGVERGTVKTHWEVCEVPNTRIENTAKNRSEEGVGGGPEADFIAYQTGAAKP